MDCEEYNCIKKLVAMYGRFEDKIAEYRVIDLVLDRIPHFGLENQDIVFAEQLEACFEKQDITDNARIVDAIQILKNKLINEFLE